MIMAALALFMASGCNAQNKQENTNTITQSNTNTMNKIVIFFSHAGSGLANCVDDVKKAFPKATVTKGFSMYGHEVRTGKAKVEKWLKGLGY